jgi:hypothetical protein
MRTPRQPVRDTAVRRTPMTVLGNAVGFLWVGSLALGAQAAGAVAAVKRLGPARSGEAEAESAAKAEKKRRAS